MIQHEIESDFGYTHGVEIAANAASFEEIEIALRAKAQGIGVLRTEILFAQHETSPTQAEQFECYKNAAVMAGL